MPSLLVHPHPADAQGCVLTVTPQSAAWKYVAFRVYRLGPGQVVRGGERGREACLVLLTGSADVTVEGQRFEAVGGRASVFDDAAPGAVYVPAGGQFSVAARDHVKLAVCTAPGHTPRAPRVLEATDMPVQVRGTGTNTPYVRDILPQTVPADSLLVVEVITPGGHWSSYPPHKHDTAVAVRKRRWKRPTTIASGRPRALGSSASIPTSAIWTNRCACTTATWSWCRAAITRYALRMATICTT